MFKFKGFLSENENKAKCECVSYTNVKENNLYVHSLASFSLYRLLKFKRNVIYLTNVLCTYTIYKQTLVVEKQFSI